MDMSFEECMAYNQWVYLLDVVSKSNRSSLNKTSIFKGVSKYRSNENGRDRFRCVIYVNNIQIYIGTFDNQYDAYKARCMAIERMKL